VPQQVLKCLASFTTIERTDMSGIPPALLSVLFPFQIRGIKFALSRGGRCIIAYVTSSS
jgi:hypothetical protein